MALAARRIARENARCKEPRRCFGLWGYAVLWDGAALASYVVEANETPLLVPGMIATAQANLLLAQGLNDTMGLL